MYSEDLIHGLKNLQPTSNQTTVLLWHGMTGNIPDELLLYDTFANPFIHVFIFLKHHPPKYTSISLDKHFNSGIQSSDQTTI